MFILSHGLFSVNGALALVHCVALAASLLQSLRFVKTFVYRLLLRENRRGRFYPDKAAM